MENMVKKQKENKKRYNAKYYQTKGKIRYIKQKITNLVKKFAEIEKIEDIFAKTKGNCISFYKYIYKNYPNYQKYAMILLNYVVDNTDNNFKIREEIWTDFKCKTKLLATINNNKK